MGVQLPLKRATVTIKQYIGTVVIIG